MIAALTFEASLDRVRTARFTRCSSLPLDAACAIARALHDVLEAAFGARCALTIGEPVALDAAAWRSLTARASVLVLPGRLTDVAFVFGHTDARALVSAAFREDAAPHDGSWSALEAGALERIIARAAAACEPVCGERSGPVRTLDGAAVPACADVFDLRVASPIALTIGVGLLRPLPRRSPLATLRPAILDEVSVALRAVLGHVTVPARRLVDLRVGDVVFLDTKVAGRGELNVATQRIAVGTCGVVNGYAAFDVQSVCMRGDAP